MNLSEIIMLAKNKSGWKLIEYIDIKEDDIEKTMTMVETFFLNKKNDY